MKSVQYGLQEDRWVESGGADLQQQQVRVHHRVGEVTLDVGHGLAPNLQTITNPHLAHDFIKSNLKDCHINQKHLHQYHYKWSMFPVIVPVIQIRQVAFSYMYIRTMIHK